MQHRAFLRGWWIAAALAVSVLAAPDAFAARNAGAHKPRPPQTAQQIRQHALVRREMFAGMKQRVHDLVMAERLLFAQRMRDLRAKSPVDR